ncbi:putative cyclin [Septoria linicola]|nr:putative cyclin [Septoria linicola]
MSAPLTEDDIYRRSTQFRFWSFSPEQLAAQRRKTHHLALARAEQCLGQQQHGARATAECLTEEEELRLVQKYCDVLRITGVHLQWQASVYTTAIQYFKRFYLNNSCMTYPPKEIYKTVMFLASKTEATHTTLSKFSRSINADPEAVLAPEYKVMQALRFMLDVRQPYRGLKGALMELLNMAEGLVDGVVQFSGQEVQQAMLGLQGPDSANRTQFTMPPTTNGKVEQKQLVERIQLAWTAAKNLLDTEASLTDVYFLYTPSQILFAALHVADTPLLMHYLDTKLPLALPSRSKILATVESCSVILASYNAGTNISKEERAALERKLEGCRDPNTKDLVKAAAAAKRNGTEEGTIDEEKAKKIKSERAKNDKDMNDLFGPSLKAGG